MTALAKVVLVVDNTKTHKQRGKRTTPSQSFLTDKHSIYGGSIHFCQNYSKSATSGAIKLLCVNHRLNSILLTI